MTLLASTDSRSVLHCEVQTATFAPSKPDDGLVLPGIHLCVSFALDFM